MARGSRLNPQYVEAKNGRVEIWATDYGYGPSGLTPTYANAGSYFDYDDLPAAGTYGSFQVHNATDGKTIFAWNHHTYNQTPDIGLGTASSNQLDWTFCYQGTTCSGRTNFNGWIFTF